MLRSRKQNNRITNLHERALRIKYNDYERSFSDFLENNGSFSVHHTNVQTLLIEIHTIKHNISGTVFEDRSVLTCDGNLL